MTVEEKYKKIEEMEKLIKGSNLKDCEKLLVLQQVESYKDRVRLDWEISSRLKKLLNGYYSHAAPNFVFLTDDSEELKNEKVSFFNWLLGLYQGSGRIVRKRQCQQLTS
jgi:hypothetical protein